MININKYVRLTGVMAIIMLQSSFLTLHSSAQKKRTAQKAKTAVKAPAAAKVNYTEYVNNPVCKVVVTDSAVVNISDLATSLHLPQQVGHFVNEDGILIYENDFGDTRLFSQKDAEGKENIYRKTLLAGKWSEPELLTVNGDLTDKAYPFPGPDGQTLYFAGKSADDNNGMTYSLYMTTWDAETSSYKVPQRLPYPFIAKDADDLMFLEDDIDSLAWLVTTRRQSEGKACIYTMSLHQPWEYYDAEATQGATLRSRALIERICDTWPSSENSNSSARQHLSVTTPAQAASGILFVINDNTVYTSLTDFRTKEGRSLFTDWYTRQQQLDTINHQLDEYRLLYSKSMSYDRRKLASTITDLEAQQTQLTKDINNLAKQIRQKEL